jgi:hypothetical protein
MPPQSGLLSTSSEVIDLGLPAFAAPSVLASLGRTGERYVTALGDRREVAVPCWACREPTLALDATCDTCDARSASARVA